MYCSMQPDVMVVMVIINLYYKVRIVLEFRLCSVISGRYLVHIS